jgi:hypothetical protein
MAKKKSFIMDKSGGNPSKSTREAQGQRTCPLKEVKSGDCRIEKKRRGGKDEKKL